MHRQRLEDYWFKRFKSGNFDTADKELSGRPKTNEDDNMQALLDEDEL